MEIYSHFNTIAGYEVKVPRSGVIVWSNTDYELKLLFVVYFSIRPTSIMEVYIR